MRMRACFRVIHLSMGETPHLITTRRHSLKFKPAAKSNVPDYYNGCFTLTESMDNLTSCSIDSGTYEPSESKSAFLMRDQLLSLLNIMQMDLSLHQFAFLVLHLEAGLQFAAVRSVVGTLWKLIPAFLKQSDDFRCYLVSLAPSCIHLHMASRYQSSTAMITHFDKRAACRPDVCCSTHAKFAALNLDTEEGGTRQPLWRGSATASQITPFPN
ncbi:uncharacterized protein F5147DRAFT_820882 [Suillus discolor]|uniref:Uncharacterized protein n=1 Tax=Suillus discolor TaxID=1912936 RepID=A0A9P7EWX9_9AGAM|nr:uncharacterized protein F5147DRAFT_820882 [Suillus discolor]KAG2093725.1 hypothetical protein F5147DRAFT_820882 [Suillus discolor]